MPSHNVGPIIDPVYGLVPADDFFGELILQPEVQRLREVRLSNINSMTMPGCAGISRFEHSVGTAHLARRVSRTLRLNRRDTAALVSAAMLHDIGITPFGHLMEESFRYAGVSFNHEKQLSEIFFSGAELGNVNYQIFRGRPLGIRGVLARREWVDEHLDVRDIFAIIRGETLLGPLISGTVDLDNIDNVCRMAYHIGVRYAEGLPLALVDGFYFSSGRLCFDEDRLSLLSEWLDLRRRLYTVLMTNPTDFVAKAMLVEAIRRALVKDGSGGPVLDVADWRMTDAELLQRLATFDGSAGLIDRFLRGDLFQLLGLYWVSPEGLSANPFTPEASARHRVALANLLGTSEEDTLVYMIKDKRVRLIDNFNVGSPRTGSSTPIRLGDTSTQILFGVAVARDVSAMKDAAGRVAEYLHEVSCNEVHRCESDLYATEAAGPPADPQIQLF